jgi:hypothetical protein
MPSNLLTACFLLAASFALLYSQMPAWVRRLIAGSFALISFIYFSDALGWITSIESKQFLVRYSLVVLSSVIIICITAWKVGVKKWPLTRQ